MTSGNAQSKKVTLCAYKADLGGFAGHTGINPDLLEIARERLLGFREKGRIRDFHVMRCGDDIEFLMTHYQGCASSDIEDMVINVLSACATRSSELKLYGNLHSFLRGDPSGSVAGPGFGLAEMEFVERENEPILVFMAYKAHSGLWNLPLYKIFADPFNTPGLVMDDIMMEGFSFSVFDRKTAATKVFKSPEQLYRLLAVIGDSTRYLVAEVRRNHDGELAAVVSNESNIDKTVGGASSLDRGEDPVLMMRCQKGLPAVGEALEAFTFPYLVEGWMRGSHIGPLMPVPFYEANPTRFDGPPRVIASGFQLSRGQLIGPHDMFDDPVFDRSRREASRVGGYMRRHGPFTPHRVINKNL